MKKFILLTALLLTSAANAQSVKADVKKIDLEAGKITLRHDPIKNLDMDGMTMVFRITPELAKGLKEGDKLLIDAERVNGAISVIKLKKQ